MTNETGDWITPAEASDVACMPGVGGVYQGRDRILHRARGGLVKARVRDAVRRTLKKLDTAAPVAPPPESVDANWVQPLGTPISSWDLPIETERRSDEPMDGEDWEIPALADPRADWWATGDLEIPTAAWTREGISLFGIEFWGPDIARLAPAGRRAPEGVPSPSPTPAPAMQLGKQTVAGSGRRRAGEGTWETQLFADLIAEAATGEWMPGGPLAVDRGAKADVVRKMGDWLAAREHEEPSATTMKSMADRLLVMIKAMRARDN